MGDRLARLGELERRFDGPIPPALLEAARLGSAGAALAAASRTHADYFTALVRGQIQAIRARHADGSLDAAMIETLALYRRERRRFRGLSGQRADFPASSRP